MYVPPDLIVITTFTVTNPAPLVPLVTPVVAAPGVGWRLRVWFYTVGSEVNSVGTFARALLQQAAPVLNKTTLSIQTPHGQQQLAFPGGMALTDNSGLNLLHIASAASVPLTLTYGYTVERSGL